jgi:hypothetical protein
MCTELYRNGYSCVFCGLLDRERRRRVPTSSLLSRLLAKDTHLVISEFNMLTHLDDFSL